MMRYLDGDGNDAIYVYTADDERFYVLDVVPDPDREVFYLRDLDGKVLRAYLGRGGVDGDWSETTDYVYRDGALLASVRPSEGIHHFHPDHLGSPRMITDQDGNVLALHAYFPFGEELVAGGDAEPMKFTGHERDFNADPATTDDLDYMHARYYSSWLGRFFSFDPVGGSLKAPQSWNRYAYTLNNPLNYTDPLGLMECRAIKRSEGGDAAECEDEIDVSDEDPGSIDYEFLMKYEQFKREFDDFKANSLSGNSGPTAHELGNVSFQNRVDLAALNGEAGDCSDPNCQLMGQIAFDFDHAILLHTITRAQEEGLLLVAGFGAAPRLIPPVPGASRAAFSLTRGTGLTVRLGSANFRFAVHAAHHSFARLGRMRHLQFNFWRSTVSGSGRVARIPLFLR